MRFIFSERGFIRIDLMCKLYCTQHSLGIHENPETNIAYELKLLTTKSL